MCVCVFVNEQHTAFGRYIYLVDNRFHLTTIFHFVIEFALNVTLWYATLH